MISIIITTYQEPQTIGRAIQAFLDEEIDQDYEILVVCPDQETQEKILEYQEKYSQVKCLKEKESKGKPAALNLAFRQTKGDILILSDGDVYIKKGAVRELLKYLKDPEIGAVSGRPVSVNSRNNCLGYWSHLLTEAAHQRRLELIRQRKFIDYSGYLSAIKKIPILNFQFPIFTLSDDAYLSQIIWQKGYKIAYAPEAMVYVKFPDNFKDWILQKKRSTGGISQSLIAGHQLSMRGFWEEIFWGTKFALKYPKNLKEFYWTILLFFARLYLWILIFWDLRVRKKKFKEIWKPVKSTKAIFSF